MHVHANTRMHVHANTRVLETGLSMGTDGTSSAFADLLRPVLLPLCCIHVPCNTAAAKRPRNPAFWRGRSCLLVHSNHQQSLLWVHQCLHLPPNPAFWRGRSCCCFIPNMNKASPWVLQSSQLSPNPRASGGVGLACLFTYRHRPRWMDS